MIEIRTLLENVGTEHKSLIPKHGFSTFIKTDSLKLVFDCGPDETALRNARLMDVKPETADVVVLSHSHYDHSGGYPDFVRSGVKGTLYTGPAFFEPKYAFDGVKHTYLGAGFDEEFLAENWIVHKECRGMVKLSEDCFLFQGFPRVHEFETIPERFVKGELPDAVTDDFDDEICVVLKTSKGLVVVVGCSHPGILNMLKKIHETMNMPIYAVLGGTHLVEADAERVEKTVEEMKDMGVEIMGLCHCSGQDAESAVHMHKDVRSCHLGVGDCFAVE